MNANTHHACHVTAPATADAAAPETNDPRTIRVALEARETQWEVGSGITISGYGYNGQVPGPIIEAKQGVPLEIAFTNNLPEPTLIHWHGLQIPAATDGTQRSRGATTGELQPP